MGLNMQNCLRALVEMRENLEIGLELAQADAPPKGDGAEEKDGEGMDGDGTDEGEKENTGDQGGQAAREEAS